MTRFLLLTILCIPVFCFAQRDEAARRARSGGIHPGGVKLLGIKPSRTLTSNRLRRIAPHAKEGSTFSKENGKMNISLSAPTTTTWALMTYSSAIKSITVRTITPRALRHCCKSPALSPQTGERFLWFFTGLHPDYHTPGDEIDRIDWDKLISITRATYLSIILLANEK